GHYDHDRIHIDLGPLCRFAGARLIHDEATGIDLAGRRVHCANRPAVAFDLLSLDIGVRPETDSVPGAAELAVPLKPIDGFATRFVALRERVLGGAGRSRIGVVGAGAGGVEILLAVRHRLIRDLKAAGQPTDGLAFHLIAKTDDILPE